MTTATDNTMRLTGEQREQIVRAVRWHMELDEGGSVSGPPELEIADLQRRSADLRLCSETLDQAWERGRLSLDADTLRLVAVFVRETEESAADARATTEDPDELAVARGRVAMLRVMLKLAEDRVAKGGGA